MGEVLSENKFGPAERKAIFDSMGIAMDDSRLKKWLHQPDSDTDHRSCFSTEIYKGKNGICAYADVEIYPVMYFWSLDAFDVFFTDGSVTINGNAVREIYMYDIQPKRKFPKRLLEKMSTLLDSEKKTNFTEKKFEKYYTQFIKYISQIYLRTDIVNMEYLKGDIFLYENGKKYKLKSNSKEKTMLHLLQFTDKSAEERFIAKAAMLGTLESC